MKLHLPVALFSALMCSVSSTHTAQAVDIPAGTLPVDLGSVLGIDIISLSGGTQTGAITGAGNLVISTGTVSIANSTGLNSYTGNTIVKAGATLSMTNWSGASATEYKQLGTGTLVLSGTLDINTGSKDPSSRLFKNNITLNDGAVIQSTDHGITFGGNISLASGTARMKMGWGNEWVFSGKKTGAGTISFERSNSTENQLFVLRGDNDTFTGTYQVSGDKTALILENVNSAKNAHIKLNAANAYLILKNTDSNIGGLTGNGRIRNGVFEKGDTQLSEKFTPGAVTKTLTVDQTNAGNDIFTGTIDSNVNLTKAGVGTLTLTNLTGYTGKLGLQGGTLNLKLTTDNVYDLASIQATTGTLSLESGMFSIGGNSIGNVSLGNATLTANGATILFDIIGTQSDKISFKGALGGTLNLDFNIVGASMGSAFTIMTTDSAENATSSLSHLNGTSQFYKGSFSASGNDILYTLSGYSDSLLQWNSGANGAWNTTGSSWKTNAASGVVFDSTKSVLFGDLADTPIATITLDAAGITAKGVLIESDTTNYTLTGGKLTTDTFVKNGSSTAKLDVVYNISKFQINEGTLELLQAPESSLGIFGKGNLIVNWDSANIANMNLTGHEGALKLMKGSIRTNLLGLASESSISMAGGSLYLSDAGEITITLPSIAVSGSGSKIIRDNAGGITWNTALTGTGSLTLNLNGEVSFRNSSFANFGGILSVNANIRMNEGITLQNNAGITLGEGKTLSLVGNTLGGTGSTMTLSKNTVVSFFNGQLNSAIVLNAAGGNVTFQGFQNGDLNTLGGKMTGSANNVIFNHEGWANDVSHNNWQGSDYLGTTIFKATGNSDSGRIRKHTYNVAASASGVITPWGSSQNLVQIGSSDTKESLNIQFSGLGAGNSVTIANNIELITGSVANKTSSLEFTSGSYVLSGNVKVINGGANKAIIKSSGADLELSGGLSGAGLLELNMATGKTLLLSGASDYTGTLTVTSGILSLGTDLATGIVQLNDNSLLSAKGNGAVGNLVLNGGNVSLSGTNNLSVKSMTDNSAGRSTITVADTSSITFKDTLAVGTKITGSGSVKIDAGSDKTVDITGTQNDYSGKTVISSGTAKAGNASAFGVSSISVSGGTLNANNKALANTISIDSGSIVNLGSQGTPKEISITALAGKTVQIDNSFLSVAGMNTAANQIINLGNGSEMMVSGNSTFVISAANISNDFASRGATVFSVSGNSALVIGGSITLDFTSDAFAAWTQEGISLSINLFNQTTGGSINLDALNSIVFKTVGSNDSWLTLTKDKNASIFADLAANGSVNVTFDGIPPLKPVVPGGAVPEPSSTGLALVGVASLLLRRRRRA